MNDYIWYISTETGHKMFAFLTSSGFFCTAAEVPPSIHNTYDNEYRTYKEKEDDPSYGATRHGLSVGRNMMTSIMTGIQ